FLELAHPEPQLFIQGVMLELQKPLSLSGLELILCELLKRHEALRLCFRKLVPEIAQSLPNAALFVRSCDLNNVGPDERKSVLEQIARELAFGLDISKPPLLRAALIEEQSKQYIMLVIHHLVIDPLSWSELLRECEEAYACWRNGQSVSFRLSAVGFTQYTARLAETALSDKTKLASEAEYWKGELGIRDMSVPVDQEGEKNTEKSTAVHTVWLTEDESKCALRLSPSRLQCTAEDVLLGAFGRSLAEWGGRDTWVVNLERNGRDMADAEWSRAVGCFSAFIPFVL